MEVKREARLKARAAVLKAMAHPSRLLIIEELVQSPSCVQELTEMVGADMSTVTEDVAPPAAAQTVALPV